MVCLCTHVGGSIYSVACLSTHVGGSIYSVACLSTHVGGSIYGLSYPQQYIILIILLNNIVPQNL